MSRNICSLQWTFLILNPKSSSNCHAPFNLSQENILVNEKKRFVSQDIDTFYLNNLFGYFSDWEITWNIYLYILLWLILQLRIKLLKRTVFFIQKYLSKTVLCKIHHGQKFYFFWRSRWHFEIHELLLSDLHIWVFHEHTIFCMNRDENTQSSILIQKL